MSEEPTCVMPDGHVLYWSGHKFVYSRAANGWEDHGPAVNPNALPPPPPERSTMTIHRDKEEGSWKITLEGPGPVYTIKEAEEDEGTFVDGDYDEFDDD